MSELVRLIHLSGLYIIAFISLEICAYFIYLYFKKKKEKIFLNKILLAYGILIGIGLTSIMIRLISNHYNEDIVSNTNINDLMHISITGAILIYILILCTKDFNRIIDNRISRSVALITIILSILIDFSQITEIRIIFIIIVIIVVVIFMSIFQIRLIKASTGVIRKRLIIITFGASLSLGTILFCTNEVITYLPQQSEIILLMTTPIMIAGLLIILFGIYEFPVFLEFDWKKELVNLYILEKKHHNQLFTYDFLKNEQTFSHELISGGILGIETIITAITDTPYKKINKIEQKGMIILLEYSDSVIYTVVVNKEMRSIHHFLNSVKESFERMYKNFIEDINLIRGKEEIYFVGFDPTVKEILER